MKYSYDDLKTVDPISDSEEKQLRYIIVFKTEAGLVNRVFSSKTIPLNVRSKMLRIFKIN